MTTITINLPDSMREFLDSELKERGIEDPSEYFQGLVIEDQKRKEWAKLHRMLEEGLESVSSKMTKDDWRRIREEVNRRHAERTRAE